MPTAPLIYSLSPVLPEDDFWKIPQLPQNSFPNVFPQPFQFEQNELAAPPFIPDEDFWTNPVAPVRTYPVLILNFDSEGIASKLSTDEAYWQNPVAPVWAYPFLLFETAQQGSISSFAPDEDYWQSAPPWSVTSPLIIFRADEDAVLVQPPAFDEDFWACAVADLMLSGLLYPQPWSFETSDSGGLVAVPVTAFGAGSVDPHAGEGDSQDTEGTGVAGTGSGAGTITKVSDWKGVKIISGKGTVCG
jgi:hypothetical protein